jgi:2-aminobenzoate-CoA ligase
MAASPAMSAGTAHLDTFARDNLPPREQWPQFVFDLPGLQFPERVNAGRLLDRAVAAGHGGKAAVLWGDESWSYDRLLDAADRIARVLVEDMGLAPGARVLLHAPNQPMTVAAWFGILKAGAIVVCTMPLLRPSELSVVVDKAEISHAVCEASLKEAIIAAGASSMTQVIAFGDGELEAAMAAKAPGFDDVGTAADDVALIAFTSGTTGKPKGCMHFHRDVLAMAETFSRRVLKPEPDEVFCGTPPFAFTFGLGGSVVFPIHAFATTAIPERPGYEALCETIQRHGVTTLFTAPTAYRAMLKLLGDYDLSSLRKCVSAGEPLPAATSEAWREATGIRIIDGIGSTEMIHIFISAAGDDIRPGATGKAVPGYEACLLGDDGRPLPPGSTGRLAVRGPTGCRYLADERQRNYVVDGWNVTGDVYRQDEDGYFWFVSRADDMIISAGYNIGAPEVEQAVLAHPAVLECAVVGAPDEARGQVVKAFVVLHDPSLASDALRTEIQDHVKRAIAPYKYPRRLDFVSELPKTQTGKLQRFRLRDPAPAAV